MLARFERAAPDVAATVEVRTSSTTTGLQGPKMKEEDMATGVPPTPGAPTSGKSISVGDVIGVIDTIQKNRGAIEGIVKLLGSIFGGLFKKKPQAPTAPISKPIPREDSPDDFPDDTIPTPKTGAKVASVRLKLARVQYPKSRFPEQYHEGNPFGLASEKEKASIEAGQTAMNWGCKFWLDLTAYDEQGREFTPDRVVAEGLAYKTEHHCGDAFIKGHGAEKDGTPKAGYETNDTEEIGNGDTAWRSSLGFLHQMKSHVDAGGKGFVCVGSVNGVKSNEFTITIN